MTTFQPSTAGFVLPGSEAVLNPRGPVNRAVVTHSSRVADALASDEVIVPAPLAFALPQGHRARVLPLDMPLALGDSRIQFAATGHRASVQLAIECGGASWTVVTGRLHEDVQPRAAEALLLDASYGLPIFRWPELKVVVAELRAWVAANAEAGRAALLGVEPSDEGLSILERLAGFEHPILVSPAFDAHLATARAAGLELPATSRLPEKRTSRAAAGALVLASPSEVTAESLPRLGKHELALASGRMRIRGIRRRFAVDRGFELSSREDWPGLLRIARAHPFKRVVATGAHAEPLARHLRELGLAAEALAEVAP